MTYRVFHRIILICIVSCAFLDHANTQDHKYYSPRDSMVVKKLKWWSDSKFGLLMHWGPYSQWGIVESWSICPEDEEWCRRLGPYANDYFKYKESYENLKSTFNPVKFNPTQWAKAARDAGMKYVVFTTKHHDGFCMFDTKETDYKITDPGTPFSAASKRDVTKEIFNAFRNEQFGIGAYFSKPDWHSRHYWNPRFPPKDRHVNYDPAKYPDKWDAFKKFTSNQIEELMTNYGMVDILWLDGGWVRPNNAHDSVGTKALRFNQDIDMNGIARMARGHQPGLIVVDRDVEGENQNYLTPEQKIPDHPLPYPWETCMTMATSWSYVPNDIYKPANTLIHLLAKIVSRGGNFLLNIAPSPQGTFDDTAYSRLKEIGEWMNVNGEAIYETDPIAPYQSGKVVFTSKKDGSIYAIYLAEEGEQLPGEITFVGIDVKGKTVTVLGQKSLISFSLSGNKTTIKIPDLVRILPPGKHAWVFRFK